MTLLDRGLGFRLDASNDVEDKDVLAVTKQFEDSDCRRFRYGICDFTAVTSVSLGPDGINPAMRIFLRVVDACPDVFFAIAGPAVSFESLDRYRPLFQELPWVTYRCPTPEEAMEWVSENMRSKYGIVPDYVTTIPLGQVRNRA